MKGQYLLATLLTAVALTPAHAGILFGRKKPPADPSQRVPELVGQVKSSPDEHKRSQAAEELRKYDPQAFPDMIPVLLDVLAHDPKAPVRAEAAHSLGKLRPVSVAVGQALEQALAKDKSMRVRIQARSALLQYHWAGYRTPKKNALPPQTQEPPLAPPLPGEVPTQAGPTQGPPLTLPPTPPPGYGQPVLPPAAGGGGRGSASGQPLPPFTTRPGSRTPDPSVPVFRLTPAPSGSAQPLPSGPAQPTLAPAQAPKLQPAPPTGEQGPALAAPPRW